MGIFSWFGSHRRTGKHAAKRGTGADIPDPDLPPSLVRTNYDDPELEALQEAAAEDVAAVQEDDKYFGKDSPANHEDML
jgi:hypothetical protein